MAKSQACDPGLERSPDGRKSHKTIKPEITENCAKDGLNGKKEKKRKKVVKEGSMVSVPDINISEVKPKRARDQTTTDRDIEDAESPGGMDRAEKTQKKQKRKRSKASSSEPEPAQKKERERDDAEKVTEEEEELSLEERRVLERKMKKLLKKEEKKKQREGGVKQEEEQRQKLSAQQQALDYLTCWYERREQWRFQKTRQTWLLQHMFDSQKVSDTHFSMLLLYLEGLRGAARETTVQKAESVVRQGEESDEEEGGATEAWKRTNRAREIIQMLS
ncbi:protein cholesin [Chanos chanos]|uniref:Protein cholesin n=1 Tax=Chanos chanos TaxID=29144 RepID=A0A6J2V303_CHACN|nr:uncharacterized protein C7orf50 homolog [Chanos chanos]